MSDEPITIEVEEPDEAPRVVLRRVEEWAKLKATHPVILVAATRYAKWECGERFDPCMVTEADYNAAVAFAENPYAVVNPSKKVEP